MEDPFYVVASLPRSGTTTLCRMAEVLGLKPRHASFDFVEDLNNGYNFFADTPFYCADYLLALAQHHPNMKVIYIDKDVHDVLHSIRNQLGFGNWIDWDNLPEGKTRLIDWLSWQWINDRSRIRDHKEHIELLCKTMGIEFLLLDTKAGWEPLCKFVNYKGDTPKNKIPWLRNTKIKIN